MSILFCDSFRHNSDGEHVDSIRFKHNVTINEFWVVPSNLTPFKRIKDFVGETKPRTFWIKIFGKSASSQQFEPLIRTTYYKEGSLDRFVLTSEFATDFIVIRGSYSVLSLCVYGALPQQFLPKSPQWKPSIATTSTTATPEITAENTATSTTSEQDYTANTLSEPLNPIECKFGSVLTIANTDSFGVTSKEISSLCGKAFGMGGCEDSMQSLADKLDIINKTCPVYSVEAWNDDTNWADNAHMWLDDIIGALEGKSKSKNILVELKACLVVITALARSPSPFLEVFVRKGIDLLCIIVQAPHYASLIRQATLRTLAHVITKPTSMEYFLQGRYKDQAIGDQETPYQAIVRLFTVPQPTRVLDTASEVLNLAHLKISLDVLHKSITASAASSISSTLIVDKLQFLEAFLQQVMAHNDKAVEAMPATRLPPILPAAVADLLQSHQLVHLLATALSMPSLHKPDSIPGLTNIYVAVRGIVMKLIATLRGLLLVSSDIDALRGLIKTLWSLKSGGEHNIVPFSFQACFATSCISPRNLAYIVAYHAQAIVELDLLLQVAENSPCFEENQSNIMRNLYIMTLHDIGRYSVLYALTLTFNKSQLNHPPEAIQGPIGVLIRSLIPTESDKQATHVMYAVAIVLSIVQSEECTELIVSVGPAIHQVVSMWETKSGLNSELKGRMQQILDWLKPSVVLKEKGVSGLVQSLKGIVSSESSTVGSTSDTTLPPTQPQPNIALATPEVVTQFSRHHLNSLLSTLRILAALGHHPSVPLVVYEDNALSTLIEMISEVSSSLEWESNGTNNKKIKHDEVKGTSVMKREKQCLNVAVATLEIITHMYGRIAQAFHNYSGKSLTDELLKFYSVLASHPLFRTSSSPYMTSIQGQLISRSSNLMESLFTQFMADSERASQTFSDLLDHILALPKNTFGGIYLLSQLLRTLTNTSDLDPNIRRCWNSTLNEPNNLEKVILVIRSMLHCSSKFVFTSLLKVVVKLVDFGPFLGVAAVSPIVDILKTAKAHSRPLVRRILYFIMELAQNAAGQAILQHLDAIHMILDYVNSEDKECQACALTTLRTLFLGTPQQDFVSPAQLLKSVKAILQSLAVPTGEWSSTALARVASCLHLLKLLASHQFGAHHILLSSLETTSEPPYFTFLQSLSLFVIHTLPPREGVAQDVVAKVGIITTGAVQLLDMLRAALSPNSWTLVHKFIKWEDNPSHPLVSMSIAFSKYLSITGLVNLNVSVENGDDNYAKLRECRDLIEDITTETAQAHGSASASTPVFQIPTFEEWYEKRVGTPLHDKNNEDLWLGNDDFVSDMATPDAAVVAAINATEEPPSAEAPNPKKPKIELPVVPKKRDLFRSRKPNTSRPPSVHVDAYKNSAGTATSQNAVASSLSIPPSPSKLSGHSPSTSPLIAKDDIKPSGNGTNSQWRDEARRSHYDWEAKRESRSEEDGGRIRTRYQGDSLRQNGESKYHF